MFNGKQALTLSEPLDSGKVQSEVDSPAVGQFVMAPISQRDMTGSTRKKHHHSRPKKHRITGGTSHMKHEYVQRGKDGRHRPNFLGSQDGCPMVG